MKRILFLFAFFSYSISWGQNTTLDISRQATVVAAQATVQAALATPVAAQATAIAGQLIAVANTQATVVAAQATAQAAQLAALQAPTATIQVNIQGVVYAVISSSTPTFTPTPTGSATPTPTSTTNIGNVFVTNMETPNQTAVAGKDQQLTQVAAQSTANAMMSLLLTSTITPTPNAAANNYPRVNDLAVHTPVSAQLTAIVALQTQVAAVLTQVAGSNAKAVTNDTSPLFWTPTPTPTANATLNNYWRMSEVALETPVAAQVTAIVAIQTQVAAIQTVVAAINAKAVSMSNIVTFPSSQPASLTAPVTNTYNYLTITGTSGPVTNLYGAVTSTFGPFQTYCASISASAGSGASTFALLNSVDKARSAWISFGVLGLTGANATAQTCISSAATRGFSMGLSQVIGAAATTNIWSLTGSQ